MKTYKAFLIEELCAQIMRGVKKKHKNPIHMLAAVWSEQTPDWAKILTPYKLDKKTLYFKSSQNALILQYKEKEIIQIAKSIINEEIERVKIIKD
jgi:hypothetical protein